MTLPWLDPDFQTPHKMAEILHASAEHCERFALALAKIKRGDTLSVMWARISGILEDAAREVHETAMEHSPELTANPGNPPDHHSIAA